MVLAVCCLWFYQSVAAIRFCGSRKYFSSGSTTFTTCVPDPLPATTCSATTVTSSPGTVNTQLTPVNSDAGTLPVVVYTDASGIATFDLTYSKTSAIWTVVRIRARTIVQGSASVGETVFRLTALKSDAEPCILPPSKYTF